MNIKLSVPLPFQLIPTSCNINDKGKFELKKHAFHKTLCIEN